MKARLSLLHKTEAEWSKLNFTPDPGEVIVYDPDNTIDYARMKIGDGQHTVQELKFLIDAAAEAILKEHQYSSIIDGGRITDYFN